MTSRVWYRFSNSETKFGEIEYDEMNNEVIVKFTCLDMTIEVTSNNYFNALISLRTELETYGIKLICNGTSLNVYPSPMSFDMGLGLMGYILEIGFHASKENLINIFEFDDRKYIESTIEEQQAYYEEWLKSKKITRETLPKYNVEKISRDSSFLFFWGHQPSKDGVINQSCLSQWYLCDFKNDGIIYSSTEQYMMAEKARLFLDNENLELILSNNNPKVIKELGKSVSNFNEDIWNKNKYSVVLYGNYLKFSQNTELGNYLKNTEGLVIVEASPLDNIWGIGMKKDEIGIENPINWKGKNLLGFALMEVRDML